MKSLLIARGQDGALAPGLVLAQDVRESGRLAFAKGSVLAAADAMGGK